MATSLALQRSSNIMLRSAAAASSTRRIGLMHHPQQQTRFLSSYILDSSSSSGPPSSRWPIRKPNIIFNIVPEGFKYVVERFGKLHSIEDSGWFVAIPLVDTISYVVDVRERAIDIPPQSAITRDNVAVEVSGNLFIQFVDPQKAAYGALDPLYSVTQHAQSAMRSAIGEMELDQILHGRARLNAMIKGALQEAAMPWGLDVKRYEITEIMPDPQIRSAMDKQAAAERDRRQKVLQAEGDKQRVQLTSEGYKIQLQNESEGMLIKIKNEAEAAKLKLSREAEGQAHAMTLVATAHAEALHKIGAQLKTTSGREAAQLSLAEKYVTMYGEMGKQSNTMMFNDRPADVSALMAQAVTAMKAVNQMDTTTTAAAMEAENATPPPPPSLVMEAPEVLSSLLDHHGLEVDTTSSEPLGEPIDTNK